jgi:predicted short-subunit dehydrogenase-like oxidoreductase (DUF2520 family)
MNTQDSEDTIKRIVCFGSGGVAWSLLPALYEAGCEIAQVFSPHIDNARTLAALVDAQAIDKVDKVDNVDNVDNVDSVDRYCRNADLVVLAVPDDAVAKLLPVFRNNDALVVHTAGALPMQVFENQDIANYGVLYPLQTFTRRRTITMTNTPIFVEANTESNHKKLFALAERISCNVHNITSTERLWLHLSAVFACNFTNHCLSIAADIVRNSNMPADILHPIVHETIAKALSAEHPRSMQTGPALRSDHATMHKHIDLLKNEPLLRKIYEAMSDSIIRTTEHT